MKYLLIDFGASYIKNIIYNTETNKCECPLNLISPFQHKGYIDKEELLDILHRILLKTCYHKKIDRIVICSILGGAYVEDTYHSWKICISAQKGKCCLISGLFEKEETFHVHEHHKHFTKGTKYVKGLEVLGYLEGIPVYSALGDTYCVIEGADLKAKEVLINIGTGSQVAFLNRGTLKIYSYIPAGRALQVFQEFFDSINLDIFELFEDITVDDVLDSSLDINLNVFEQAFNYDSGGFISNINEGSFTIKNLLGSIIKQLISQYRTYIEVSKASTIVLAGGVVKNLRVLRKVFRIMYPFLTIRINNENEEEDTHKGMVVLIKKYLENGNTDNRD